VYDRIGGRRKQAELVIQHFIEIGKLDSVNLIDLQSFPNCSTEELPPEDGDGGTRLVSGSVYLFKSGDEYKIGLTNDLGRRQGQFKTLTSKPMLLIHEIKSDDIYGIEKYWHRRFDSVRCNGEWFKLSAEHIKAFRKRKFM
jgi:hypothetical protein